MAATSASNYKEIFPEDTVTIIESLKEHYELTEILEVLDVFGDDWAQEHLETILNTEDRDALYEFLQEYGNTSLEYYEKFVGLYVLYDEGAVKAYIKCVGIDYLDDFQDAYYEYFSTVREFVEDYLESHEVEIPSWVVLDYEATWNSSLRHDYLEENGYYFRRI